LKFTKEEIEIWWFCDLIDSVDGPLNYISKAELDRINLLS